MTTSPLYRSEVLEAKRNRWLGSLILRQPLSHWVSTWIAIATVVIAVALLYAGEYARKVRIEGHVVASSKAVSGASGQRTHLEVELLVPERLLASAGVGHHVLLRYPAFPQQRYGQYRGRIVGISREPLLSMQSLASDTASTHARSVYRATVSLERQRVSDDRQIERDLQPGLSVEADVVVERRRLYQWLFEPFSRVRERLHL
jgi:membrane fusion protein